MTNRQQKLALNTCGYIKPFIAETDQILDVGMGSGFVLDYIKRYSGAKIQGIDVINVSQTTTKPIIYDGVKIPFADNAFSVSICSFVLHHASEQSKLLSELARVSQSTIIIFEDTPETPFEIMLTKIHALLSILKFKSENPRFHGNTEWKNIFDQSGLTIAYEERISRKRDLVYPVRRKMYILKKA
jgi:SAM-dependent methyltransferase